MSEKFYEQLRLENAVIYSHIAAIRYHLKQVEELSGTWHMESEGTVEKFDGTRMPRRTGIRFDGVMDYLDTIWEDEV